MEKQNQYPCLKINAPELAEHERFKNWLNAGSGYSLKGPRVATWHRAQDGGEICEFSDVFVWKDVGREGSDSDMPEDVWNQLCEMAGEGFAGILWITFLE